LHEKNKFRNCKNLKRQKGELLFLSKALNGHFSNDLFGELFFQSKQYWHRCYDFKNIFTEKFGENIGIFCSNYCLFMQKFDHNIGI
jgi:hypothetical protein